MGVYRRRLEALIRVAAGSRDTQADEGYMGFFQRRLEAPDNRPTMSDLADDFAAKVRVCLCVCLCVCV